MAADRSLTVYARLLGVDPALIGTGANPTVSPALADIIYYSYRKGFWPYLRGLTHRLTFKRCAGRLFVGRGATILFPSRLSVGRNVAIGDFVFLNCYGRDGIVLADNVRLREFGWVQATSHLNDPGIGLAVGRNTYIGPHSVLGAGGGISIGEDVAMGAYVQLLAEDHGFRDPSVPINRQGVTRRGITIEDGCWLGNSVIVLDGVTVGRGSVIGAGSVVTKDIPPASVAVGNPARIVGSRSAT